MRAAVLESYHADLRVTEMPQPPVGPSEVLVKVEACGICGSDLFLQKGGFGGPLPIIPGHEASGRVVEIGEEVNTVSVGQQVAIYYIRHCGTCRFCTEGRPNICSSIQRLGVDLDGALAEYVVVPEANVIPTPSQIPAPDLAVLTDAVATPYHALTAIGRITPGQTVVVIGVGGIGSNAVQLAKIMGARVIAVSRSPEKLALAERLGADVVIPSGEGVVARVRAEAGGTGPDAVLQCVGDARVDEEAVAMVGNGGRVVLVGASTEPFRARSVDLIWREAGMLGSRGFTPSDICAVIEIYLKGQLRTDHLTAHLFPLSDVNHAFADLANGRTIRAMVIPTEEGKR